MDETFQRIPSVTAEPLTQYCCNAGWVLSCGGKSLINNRIRLKLLEHRVPALTAIPNTLAVIVQSLLNMKKTVLLFFIFICSTGITYSQVDYDSCILKISRQQLISELARYSDEWVNDSLANNGFRRFFGREFFRCSGKVLVDTNWNTIAKYLGKPHFTFKDNKNFIYNKQEILHRYVLYTYGDYRNFKDVGNTILDIIVVKGIVKGICVYDVDG